MARCFPAAGAAVLFVSVLTLGFRAANADGPPSSSLEREHASGTNRDAPASGPEAIGSAPWRTNPQSVFFIQRNKNRNEVHYGVRLDSACRPAGADPMYNYWLRLEKGPDVIEDVKFFQQAAYGFKSQRVSGDAVDVVLRALPKQTIRVVTERADDGSCRTRAYTHIGGEPAVLDKAYVYAEEGWVLPDVKYIDLFGWREDGTPVRERIEID